MKAIMLTALALLLSSGLAWTAENPPVQGQSPNTPGSEHPTALTDTQCDGIWDDAAGGNDMLTGDKAGGFFSDLKQADANQDGNISEAEFKAACKKGLIKAEHVGSAKMGKGEGTHPGAAGETPPPVESGKMEGR